MNTMDLHKIKYPLYLALITLATTIAFWSIFYYNLPKLIGFPDTNLETVFANYDGPNYLVIAKCGYNRDCIRANFSLPQPLEYYPAHFPAYPLLIRFFDNFTTGPKAMILTTLLGSLLLSVVIFYFFKQKFNSKLSFWLSLLFLFFPARLLALRLVGAPETWFISFILLSVIYFRKQNYPISALMASLSLAFKSPGVILGLSYLILAGLELIHHRSLSMVIKKYFVYLMLPLTLILIFNYYNLQTGDFLAYFHSGDNIHLYWLPYSVFISNHSWINTIWLEEVIYIFTLSFFGIRRLLKKYGNQIYTIFPLIFTLLTLFVGHRDISRYLSPVYPFLFIAFSSVLKQRYTKLIFLILFPAIILYTINFIIGNTAPIADWTPYL